MTQNASLFEPTEGQEILVLNMSKTRGSEEPTSPKGVVLDSPKETFKKRDMSNGQCRLVLG